MSEIASDDGNKKEKQSFAEVVTKVATDLDQLAEVLRGILANGSDELGRAFADTTVATSKKNTKIPNEEQVPKMPAPVTTLASIPFSVSTPRTPKATPLAFTPDSSCPIVQVVHAAVLPPDPHTDVFYHSESMYSEFDTSHQGDRYNSDQEEQEKITSERSTFTIALREPWSKFDEHVLNEYITQMKQKPKLEKAPSSIGNLFHIGFERKYTSQSSASLNLLISMFRWSLSPTSTFRLAWDVISMLFLTNDVFMVPLQVFHIPDSVAIQVVEVFCRLFWMADIVMSFRTGFYDYISLEMRPSYMARHYFRTWFFVDLVVICIDWTKMFIDHVVCEALQLARLIRLYKLVRFRRTIIERSNSNRVHLYLDCVDIAVWCAIAVHLISCGWYWLGERANGWTTDSHMQGADLFYSYFSAARWTIAQVSGRTDIELRTASEYLYTVCACVFGLVIMSLMISSITNTMIELGQLNRDRSSKSRALNGFLKRHHVVSSLALRAKGFLGNQHKIVSNSKSEEEVLAMLPRQITADLLFEIHGPLIMEHVLFSDLGREFPRMLRRVCADVVTMIYISEDELAFAKGDACTRMLFVKSGLLHYTWKQKKRPDQRLTSAGLNPAGLDFGARLSESAQAGGTVSDCITGYRKDIPEKDGVRDIAGREARIIRQKQWLSEAAIWIEWEHRGDLRGCELSSLLVLDVESFMNVVKLFRWAKARAILYAKAFIENLQYQEKWSDVMEPIRGYIDLEQHELVLQTVENEDPDLTLNCDEEFNSVPLSAFG